MAKTEVYSWRLDPATRQALEEEAARAGISLAELLERMAADWLASKGAAGADSEAEQDRLRRAVLGCAGTIAGGDPDRAADARHVVRQRLASRRAT